MSDAPQPTSATLSAKVIRACTKHNNKCALECPRRKVEDLGEVARFDLPEPTLPNPSVGLKTGNSPGEEGLLSRISHLFRKE